jgi:hypothetical protein
MKQTLFRRLSLIAAISTFCVSGHALAQATGGPSEAERTPPQFGRPPEQAAIDACKDKNEGDRVRFVDAKGKSRRFPCARVDGVLAARSGVATAAHKVTSK